MFRSFEQVLKELKDSGRGARVYVVTREQFEELKNEFERAQIVNGRG